MPIILSISSNDQIHSVLRRTLEAEGVHILEARSPAEGLAALAHQPDLVLLEVPQPEQGIETCRELKRRGDQRDVPVILVSTQARSLELDLAGIDAHLTGPISPQLLGNTVRSLLRARNAEENVSQLGAERVPQGASGENSPTATQENPEAAGRERAEAALRQSEDRLAHVIQSIHAATSSAERAQERERTLLRLLQVVSSVANETTDAESALRAAMTQVCRLTDWPIGHVYWVDPHTRVPSTSGIWYGEDAALVERLRQLTAETGLLPEASPTGRVTLTREAAWAPDLRGWLERGEPELPRLRGAAALGVRSVFVFPVLVEGEVAAVLEFFSLQPRPAEQALLRAAGWAGEQLGHVIQRRRAEQSARENEQLLERIIGFQREVAACAGEAAQVRQLAVDRVRELTGAEGAALEIREGDGLVIRAVSGTAAVALGDRLPLDRSLSGVCLRERRGVVCGDTERDPRANAEFVAKVNARSMSLMPLLHDDECVGVLKLHSHRAQAFSGRDLTALEIVVGTLGTALRQAEATRARQEDARRLARSEERLRMLVEQVPGTLWTTDSQMSFVSASGQSLQAAGLEADEVLGRSLLDLISSPEDAVRFRARWEAAFGGSEVQFETEWNGRCFENYLRPLRDATGGIVGVTGMSLDVSERRWAEELREQQNRVLRLVATGAPLGEVLTLVVRYIEAKLASVIGSIVLVDEDDRLRVVAAPGLPDSYNREVDGLRIGPQVGSCGTAAWRKAPVIVRDIAEDELWASYRDMAQAAGLRACWSTPITDGSGGVLGTFALYGREPREPSEEEVRLVGFLTDLARIAICHHRTQEALRTSEQRFRELAENLSEVFWVYDAQRRSVVYVSPAYERVWGRPARAPLQPGYASLNYVHPEDQERAERFLSCLATGSRAEADYRILRPDGGERWIWTRAIPVHDTEGRLVRMLGIVEDISERKLVEAQVLQSQRLEAVGRLAGGVAHDFNNMLAVINGYSSLLLAGLREADPSYEAVGEILRAGERAAGLTQQLLAFSRRQMIAPRVLDLNEIVEQTDRMLRPLISGAIELTLRLSPELGRVRADAGQLQQVLMNLAVNARDAMPAGGHLTIRTENVTVSELQGPPEHPLAKGDYVMLSVSDTGMGISAEVLPHLFEPFFTTKEPGKGTGLGLATVHGIVEQTGGRILVDTELACGSTFRVLLPRVTEPPDPEAAQTMLHLPAGSETILLVEDEPMVRGLAVQILRSCGYRVLEAEHAKAALRLFGDHGAEIDLLLTDVVMPGISGRELAEQLRAARPGLRVLLMSGYTDDTVVHLGFTESKLAFLSKPFTSTSLAEEVRRALDS